MAGNRRMIRLMCVVVAFIFCGVSVVLAAVPTTINYQGQLIDGFGDPVPDGSYDMQFYLFDAATGGNQLWNNPNGEQQTVNVNDGVYNVQLGAIEALDSTIFEGGAVWLEIAIYNTNTTNWETLSPRQLITATAYSLKAGDADTLGGVPASDFAADQHSHTGADITGGTIEASLIDDAITRDSELVWGNIGGIPADILDGDDTGIQTETDPTVEASVKDGVSWTELSGIPGDFADGVDNVGISSETDPQVGINTPNYISRWNGSALVSGSIYDNGNIGIGTAIPEYKLDVRNGRIQLKEDSTDHWIAMRTDGGALDLQFEGAPLYLQSLSEGDHLLLNPTGLNYVGIGTPYPHTLLHVRGGNWDLFNTEGDFKLGTASYNLKMGVAHDGADAGTANILAQGGANRLNLGAGDNYDFTIKDDNVGIGLANPSERLAVGGNIQASGEYMYETAKTHYYNIHPAEFVGSGRNANEWRVNSQFGNMVYDTGIVSNWLFAGVHLPQGATITAIAVRAYNGISSWFEFNIYLQRKGFEQTEPETMGDIAVLNIGTPTLQYFTRTDSSITNPIVDNQTYAYIVALDWRCFLEFARFYGCRITYTLDTLKP
jgi:hypothetical protein